MSDLPEAAEPPPSGPEVKTEPLDPDMDPTVILMKMTEVIQAGVGDSPEEVARRLLFLQGAKGRKLLFLRPDLFQIFAIWNRKIAGETRV